MRSLTTHEYPAEESNLVLQIHNLATPAETPRENADSQDRAAPGAARSAENGPQDAELRALIDAWPRLTDAQRRLIMVIVRKVRS
jgi:hypothetical protein